MTKFERKQSKRQERQREREIAIHKKNDENMKRDGQYVMRLNNDLKESRPTRIDVV